MSAPVDFAAAPHPVRVVDRTNKNGPPPAGGRSASAEVRNPLLRLPAARRVQDLPDDTRALLSEILLDLSREAHARAEASWQKRKAPMAVYWRSVGVYARHFSRLLRR